MNRLRKNGPALRLLQKAPTSLQKNILDKASPELIRCICDCAHNVLQGNVTLSCHYKKKLSQHKTELRMLADRKVVLKKKKRLVQTGGLFPLLLSALAPVISAMPSNIAK